MASILNSRLQNRKERPNQTTNNGDMDESAKPKPSLLILAQLLEKNGIFLYVRPYIPDFLPSINPT